MIFKEGREHSQML